MVHLIIQKTLNEVFSEGSIEPSTGGVGFYSNVFVPKNAGGLWPILSLK